MKSTQKTFIGRGGKEIHYYHWESDAPKAIIQIAHGMGEHAGRYAPHAAKLNQSGYTVLASDHRGHGLTGGIKGNGYFEDGDFWEDTIADVQQLTSIIEDLYKGLPIIFMGHSMGSMLARDIISRNKNSYEAVVLSGTGGDPGLLGSIGLLISKINARLFGRNNRSEFLRKLSFGRFAGTIKNPRTNHDWLSTVNEEVDKYVADPLCGNTFTSGYWVAFLKGVIKINKSSTFEETHKDLPIYLFSGGKDPVGDFGKGVKEVAARYKDSGIKDVTTKIYIDGRHEMLNEANSDEVLSELVQWLDDKS